jgi:hypothetical protein
LHDRLLCRESYTPAFCFSITLRVIDWRHFARQMERVIQKRRTPMSLFTLKNTLIIDAITCTGLFVFCVFATATVAAILGLPSELVTVAGWIGLPSALLMLFVAYQKEPSKGLANLIAVGNLGWVIASFAVLAIFAGQMTAIGITVVIVQAIGVLVFAIYEAKGAAALPRAVTV